MLGRGFRESSDHPPFPRGTSWRLAKLARQVPKHRTTCSLEDVDKKDLFCKKVDHPWNIFLPLDGSLKIEVQKPKSNKSIQKARKKENKTPLPQNNHLGECQAPESALKVSSPLFLQSLRKEEVPHLVITWNQWSWCWSERGFRTIDKQPGPGRCPTGSQSRQAGVRGFCTCQMWSRPPSCRSTINFVCYPCAHLSNQVASESGVMSKLSHSVL